MVRKDKASSPGWESCGDSPTSQHGSVLLSPWELDLGTKWSSRLGWYLATMVTAPSIKSATAQQELGPVAGWAQVVKEGGVSAPSHSEAVPAA